MLGPRSPVPGPWSPVELHLLHGWEEVYFPKRLMEAALGGVGMKGCKLKVKQLTSRKYSLRRGFTEQIGAVARTEQRGKRAGDRRAGMRCGGGGA